MTSEERKIIKQVKEELVVLRLQTKVLTEEAFKKQIGKIIRMVENLNEENEVKKV